MSLPKGFFDIHRGLDREGPGLPKDVAWAVALAGLSGQVRVCDAGCGPGADLVTLADTLPEARIDGIDGVEHFVEEAQDRVARFGDRVRVRVGDMAAISGPYDLIWCAGALYFLGVTEGLKTWRKALAPGGAVAFSEPCLDADASDAARAFWQGEGTVGDLASIRARVAAAGYEILGERMITGAAWQAYYAPMEARIAVLKAAGRGQELTEAIAQAEAEIANWRAAPEEIAYVLMLVRPA